MFPGSDLSAQLPSMAPLQKPHPQDKASWWHHPLHGLGTLTVGCELLEFGEWPWDLKELQSTSEGSAGLLLHQAPWGTRVREALGVHEHVVNLFKIRRNEHIHLYNTTVTKYNFQ